MVEREQLGRVELPARRRRVVGTGLLLEKDPCPLLDGKQRGDRLQAAIAAAGTGAAVRVDDGVAYLAAAKEGAPVDLAVDDKGGADAVVDVDDAKISVSFPALPLLGQRQHDAVVVHHHLAAEALLQQILELDRRVPGGLRHGLRHPGGRVDLAVYRQRQPDRQPLMAALVLVVVRFNQAQQLIGGLRGYLLGAELIQRGDQVVHQYALQAGGADVEAEDGALVAGDAVAAAVDAALGEILLAVADRPLGPLATGDAVAAAVDAAQGEVLLAVADGAIGHQLVEDLADRRDGELAVAGQGGLARLLELVEQRQQHLLVVVAYLLVVQANDHQFTKLRLLYCVIFKRKSPSSPS
ncbi:hypothetical protein D3C73_730580 [compost metagenome]